MVFSFHHLKVDYKNKEKWTLMPFDFQELKQLLNDWQLGMQEGHGWNALFWCCHDQPRVLSRFGDDKNYPTNWAKQASAARDLICFDTTALLNVCHCAFVGRGAQRPARCARVPRALALTLHCCSMASKLSTKCLICSTCDSLFDYPSPHTIKSSWCRTPQELPSQTAGKGSFSRAKTPLKFSFIGFCCQSC